MYEESNNIIFFGGVVVSIESEISNFRNKNGLYSQYDIQQEYF